MKVAIKPAYPGYFVVLQDEFGHQLECLSYKCTLWGARRVAKKRAKLGEKGIVEEIKCVSSQ